ncbi:hypothetical protein DPMN_161795 [Dreissena polymorpha]|uniref:Uncharacterized protein n=1 Tax=Dreissena polymorpha TaxID=45954 RepID=A0A9D4IRF1_DREPO|nr:hypothetical protein DPMN_161795 [Dreissena polymorpha]
MFFGSDYFGVVWVDRVSSLFAMFIYSGRSSCKVFFQSSVKLSRRFTYIVIFHRGKTPVTEEKDQKKENKHVKSALRTNGYPDWIFRLPKKKEKVVDKDEEHKIVLWQAYLTSGALQKYWQEYSENMEPTSSINPSIP